MVVFKTLLLWGRGEFVAPCSTNAQWSSCRKRTVTSSTHCLHVPAVFMPCRGVAHSSLLARVPDPRHPQCQTKHGAYVGVTQGQPENNARSWGVSTSVRVAVVPWPLSRWSVGSLLTRTEEWRGRGRQSSDWAQWFAAKRKTCLVVLQKQSHNAPVQVAAEGKRVCL